MTCLRVGAKADPKTTQHEGEMTVVPRVCIAGQKQVIQIAAYAYRSSFLEDDLANMVLLRIQ